MKFTKMHGTGNDFVVIDARVREADWPRLAVSMCDRHFGIGADGLIIINGPRDGGQAHFRMRMFNPDGSEAEMCGNGIRCLARYVLEEGLLPDPPEDLLVDTESGLRRLRVAWRDGAPDLVRVGMGVPDFRPANIPVDIPDEARGEKVSDYSIMVDGQELKVSCVSMGNPHAVCFIEEPVDEFDLARVGPLVERLPMFPQRVNFEIVNVIDRGHMAVRVWERGAGLTLACGTGACAAMAVARGNGLVNDTVDITLPGGHLTVAWEGVGEALMTGPAERVFTGVWGE